SPRPWRARGAGALLLPRAQVRTALDEEPDQARIEVAPREAPQLGERLVDRPRRLVRAVGDERVVDIADGTDARDERDLVALEPQGIARAVPLLVVRAGDDLAHLHDRRARPGEHLGPDDRVRLHQLPLIGLERTLLEQHAIGD